MADSKLLWNGDMVDITSLSKEQQQRDFNERYKNSWKLTCNGIVIDQIPARLNFGGSDFCRRMLTYFKDHIEAALTQPDWKFDNKQSAAEWRAGQENRLGIRLSLCLKIHEPGEVLPLCPYLASGRQ